MLKQFVLVLMLTHAILASRFFDNCTEGQSIVMCASDPCNKVVPTMYCRTNLCGSCFAECFDTNRALIPCVQKIRDNDNK